MNERTTRSSAFQKKAKRLVTQHVARFGWWCSGIPEIEHEPHVVPAPTDMDFTKGSLLTVDHIIPLSWGGSLSNSINLRVVCFAANQEVDAWWRQREY